MFIVANMKLSCIFAYTFIETNMTFKQRLIDNPKDYKSETDILETFFFEKSNLFCMMFNAKLFTFKTWNGFVNKRNYFIEKYNLS